LPREIRGKLELKKGSKIFVVLDNDEIRMKAIKDNDTVPVFSEKSTFFNLIGSFKGAENLAEEHDKYLAEEDE
jgi:bifunctional DNA-binding transcriptional regulator/antitoxin component of YhaV-PrlF toxin-antitoxin module